MGREEGGYGKGAVEGGSRSDKFEENDALCRPQIGSSRKKEI